MQGMIVDILESEGLVDIAVAATLPETDETPIGSILGGAVAHHLARPRDQKRKRPFWEVRLCFELAICLCGTLLKACSTAHRAGPRAQHCKRPSREERTDPCN